MKILILASVWCQNLWDELIVKNEIKLLREELWPHPSLLLTKERATSKARGGGVSFKVASYDPKNPVFQIEDTSYFEYFPIGIKNPKNIFRNIKNLSVFLKNIIWSDYVVIWWGGIIYDSELQSVSNPLKQWLFRVRVAKFFRKKIYFYALWIDIKNQENFKILKKIFLGAYKITVRDIKSWEQLKKVGIESELVDDPVMSDLALESLALVKSKDSGKSLWLWEENLKNNIIKKLSSKKFSLRDFEGVNFSGKQVWLALRKWYIWSSGDDRIERLLVEELCQHIEASGGNIIFLPHSLHQSDEPANDFLFMQQFVKWERKILADLKDVYGWYKQWGENKMIISMRLHSIILAAVYGISQLVLSYSQKTDEIIKKLSK